ncbi:hypothetical protein DSBG_1370 [Desulfosporosinus sp. BG]|nr:hypothetical protein DSBG_1370 [Desulfosporosinus sp. BG]
MSCLQGQYNGEKIITILEPLIPLPKPKKKKKNATLKNG